MLATVAAVTERMRIGTFVLNVDLRHPAVLAQELASLDVLSGGRLEIGMGAGWNQPEYAAIGLDVRPGRDPGRPADRGRRGAQGLLRRRPVQLAGEHYRSPTTRAPPKPVQRPHPPFFLGGGGRRALTLAGREADIVGLAPRPGDPRSIDRGRDRGEDRLGPGRGRRPVRGPGVQHVPVGRAGRGDQRRPRPAAAARARPDPSAERRRADRRGGAGSPHIFIGSVDGLAEKCLELRERFGISSIMLDDPRAAAGVIERLKS